MKETYVQSAIEAHVTRPKRPYKSGDAKPLLWASDMNKCKRKAMLRVTGLTQPETVPDTKMQLYFQAGNMWEDDTRVSLQWYYGDTIIDELVLKNDYWSGRCDFVLHHDNPDEQTVLIEHKSTGGKWWNYQDNLPKPEHIGQLYTYWHLYQEEFGTTPKLVLFYRAWGHWAEFYITPIFDGYVQIHGWIDGKAMEKRLLLQMDETKLEMEEAYDTGELPDRMIDKSLECEFRGKPSCQYYNFCWGNQAKRGKVEDEIELVPAIRF